MVYTQSTWPANILTYPLLLLSRTHSPSDSNILSPNPCLQVCKSWVGPESHFFFPGKNDETGKQFFVYFFVCTMLNMAPKTVGSNKCLSDWQERSQPEEEKGLKH